VSPVDLYTLAFDNEARKLEVVARSEVTSPHSWLSFNSSKDACTLPNGAQYQE